MTYRKIIFTCFVTFFCHTTFAQGIRFEKDLTWEQVKAKAKTENKYIFLDCYATWCAPCKWMAKNIFTTKEVGDYYNSHFINVSVQMDQTKNDGPDIKRWYDDAKLIDKAYGVGLYPTYLYFLPDGTVIHRIVGGVDNPGDFIDKTEDVFKPGKQYYSILNYKDHLNDSSYLKRAFVLATEEGDQTEAYAISSAYIKCIKEPFTKDNIQIVIAATKIIGDGGFQILLSNPSRVNQILGEKTYTEQFLRILIAKQMTDSILNKMKKPINWVNTINSLNDRFPTLRNVNDMSDIFEVVFKKGIETKEINPLFQLELSDSEWTSINNRIKGEYIGLPLDQFLTEERIDYYKFRKNLPQLEKITVYYANRYAAQLSDARLNEIAWDIIFLNCSDHEMLELGLKMSKQTIANYPNTDYHFIDTYANLLYKLGDKENAIMWEKNAIALVDSGKYKDDYKTKAKEPYELAVKKMLMGEKTWPLIPFSEIE